ncbi:hypothetical protein D3C79_900730 [compost metagenome]
MRRRLGDLLHGVEAHAGELGKPRVILGQKTVNAAVHQHHVRLILKALAQCDQRLAILDHQLLAHGVQAAQLRVGILEIEQGEAVRIMLLGVTLDFVGVSLDVGIGHTHQVGKHVAVGTDVNQRARRIQRLDFSAQVLQFIDGVTLGKVR